MSWTDTLWPALLAVGLAGCGQGQRPDPVDLIPIVRLSADPTRAREGLLWPREAEDAIACVRDGHADTGYKVPVDRPARIEIDLQPWFEQAIPLASLAATWAGGLPDRARVELAPGCGLAPDATLDWSAPDRALDLGGVRAGCASLIVESAQPIDLTDLALLGRVEAERLVLPRPAPAPIAHPTCGVIEGFYGVPWSHRERLHMLHHLAALGLGSYLYGPKLDPLHRANWRTPYPQADLDRFAALAAEADALDVRFMFGLSPFIDFDPDDPAYQRALLEKLSPLVEAGVSGVALLADDIEFEVDATIDGALGAAHARVTNALLEALRGIDPDLTLWFVPTVYTDGRLTEWPGGGDYLAALGALDPDVRLMWVGPGVFNETLAPEDLAAYQAHADREPQLWDNYWANDGGDGFLGRLLLAPYAGHDPALIPATAGIAQNPSIQGALARLTTSTFARWLDGERDDFDAARALAATDELGFAGLVSQARSLQQAEDLGLVMEAFEANGMQTPGHRAMERHLAALRASIASDAAPAALLDDVGALLGIFGRLACLSSSLHHSRLSADLIDDLVFPVQRLAAEGEQGLWALAALAEKLQGDDGTEALAAADDARRRSLQSRFAFSPQAISDLLEDVSGLPASPAGARVLTPALETPECRVGQDWIFAPFGAGVEVQVHGLAGATVDGQTVHWEPPHAGRYRAVVTATVEAPEPGWGFWMGTLICKP